MQIHPATYATMLSLTKGDSFIYAPSRDAFNVESCVQQPEGYFLLTAISHDQEAITRFHVTPQLAPHFYLFDPEPMKIVEDVAPVVGVLSDLDIEVRILNNKGEPRFLVNATSRSTKGLHADVCHRRYGGTAYYMDLIHRKVVELDIRKITAKQYTSDGTLSNLPATSKTIRSIITSTGYPFTAGLDFHRYLPIKRTALLKDKTITLPNGDSWTYRNLIGDLMVLSNKVGSNDTKLLPLELYLKAEDYLEKLG